MNNVGSKLMSKNQDHQDILHQTSLKIQRDSFLEVKKKKSSDARIYVCVDSS